MNLFKLSAVVFFAFPISGCANHPFNAVNSTSYSDGGNGSSRVFAWDSTYSAGVGNSNGMCVQGALTAKSTAFSAALEAAVEKINTNANGGVNFAEAVMALNATSVQTAYANSGYFYLCQIALNAGTRLNSTEIVSMWKHVGDTARALTMPSAELMSLSAPQLKQVRAYLEQAGATNLPDDDAELQQAITGTIVGNTSSPPENN